MAFLEAGLPTRGALLPTWRSASTRSSSEPEEEEDGQALWAGLLNAAVPEDASWRGGAGAGGLRAIRGDRPCHLHF
ncbi:hypothetical protein HXX76_013697 [Chlamydomonas incerta]|uniref:Uncharacterized protein n=1 Tax=Chlamydomonas incerta TaxID=51695 RepID=A0A835VTP6_CHLIN|nr:hypothetical protein HXX76_013697 [Chlamydomonas incerta]|eukprot:KAG2425488.1 hypothetical protein HXX76_013697 [Chlamydomonas incerta]